MFTTLSISKGISFYTRRQTLDWCPEILSTLPSHSTDYLSFSTKFVLFTKKNSPTLIRRDSSFFASPYVYICLSRFFRMYHEISPSNLLAAYGQIHLNFIFTDVFTYIGINIMVVRNSRINSFCYFKASVISVGRRNIRVTELRYYES